MRRLLPVLLLSSLAHAAQTYVVAAGVEQYDDARISSLKFAAADARAVAAAFRASGVPRQNVALLTTEARAGAARPTRIQLITALESAGDRCQPGDTLIFFFGGHGVEQDGEQYLLTSDTRRSLLAETALPIALVNKSLRGTQARQVLFILDACRNDPDAGKGDTDARMTDGLARGLRPKVSGQTGGPKLTATLLSCDVGERAYEDPASGHGAFTVALLRGMRGAAAAPGQPVTLKHLSGYVADQVRQWAIKEGKQQTPKLLNPDGQDMALLTPSTEPVVSVGFRNVTLSEAIDELATEYGAQIVLGPGVDAGARVNGRLELQPLSTALRVLLLACGLVVRRDGQIYIIEKPADQAAPQPTAPESPRAKAWRVDASRHLVDAVGQRLLPLTVHLCLDKLGPAEADRCAATLGSLGVELLWLQVRATSVTDGDPGLTPTVGMAQLDDAVRAVKTRGLKMVLLPAVQQDAKTHVTERDAPLWAAGDGQDRYLRFLTMLARRYAAEGDTVIGMGLLSDPNPPSPEVWRDLATRAIAAVRAGDPALAVMATPPFDQKADWQLALPDNAMIGGWAERWFADTMAQAVQPGEGAFVTAFADAGTWDGLQPAVASILRHGYVPCLYPSKRPMLRQWADGQPAAEFAGFKQAVLDYRRQLAAVAGRKVWHIDNRRHLVDREGRDVFPVAVHVGCERLEWEPAGRSAATMKAAGVELVWLQIAAGAISNGDPGQVLTAGVAELDHGVAALKKVGLKAVVLIGCQQGANGCTNADAPLWRSAADQDRYCALLSAVAQRYQDERETVIGMGLLSDPNPPTAAAWRDLASKLVEAIRTADPGLAIFASPPYSGAADWHLALPDNAMLGGYCGGAAAIAQLATPGEQAMITFFHQPPAFDAAKGIAAALSRGFIPCRWLDSKPKFQQWAASPPAEFATFKQAIDTYRATASKASE